MDEGYECWRYEEHVKRIGLSPMMRECGRSHVRPQRVYGDAGADAALRSILGLERRMFGRPWVPASRREQDAQNK